MTRFATIALVLVTGSLTRAAPPNVILIVADDLGWADLGCYGSTYHKTPHLDKLAATGARFTQAYASCPVCSPTRTALLTGKHPARVGITDWLPGRPDRPDQRMLRPKLPDGLPLSEHTIAEHFKAAGYATAHIGKWHLGGARFEPTKQGFDLNIGGDQTGTTRSYFAPFRNKQGTIPGLETAPDGEYLTDRLTAEAVKFVEASADKPFFLYLAHYAPHTPLRAKPDVQKKYDARPVPGKQSNPTYAAMLESVDDGIGRVMATLAEKKLTDNTYVLFTSDNGGLATLEGLPAPPTINAPLREGKGFLYEGGLRVPLIMAGPGIKPGVRTDPVTSHDLFPTLADVCKLPAPKDIDGTSVAAAFIGSGSPPVRRFYWHYPHYSNQTSRPGGAVRDGDWKLIEFYDTGRRELFDLKADSRETKNLAVEKPDVVEKLAKHLAGWRTAVGARLMTPNPDYLPNPPAADGTITLPAKFADVTGSQLRFEPLPHKNCLGYWTNAGDTASWAFTATAAGTFNVEVLQGCGTGQGGSVVEVEVGTTKLPFTVIDTGGFQAFKPVTVGTVTIDKPGRHTLTLRPKSKANAAVMDVRQMTLTPAK